MATKKKAAEKAQPKVPAAVVPAAPTHKPGMKIIAMRVENIKRVKFAQIRPKGAVVTIAGNNEQGKSTILDAIDWAINGTGNITSMPIRKGQRTGRIEVDLGDFKVVRDFTLIEGGKEPYLTKLTVMGKRMEKFPSPQSLLDEFMGAISFDPLEFIRMKPAEQLKTLRSLVTLDVDLDQVDEDKKTAYDLRRDLGRDWDSAKARLAALPAPPVDLPAEAIDTAALTEKLQNAANHNSVVKAKEQEKLSLAEDAQAFVDANKLLMQRIEDLRSDIERLGSEMEANVVTAKRKLETSLAMEIPEAIDTAEVARELQSAQVTNGAIERRNQYQAVEEQVKTKEAEWTEQDTIVKAKEQEKTEAIARAKMPIEKLSIGEGEVIYDGVPFSQASNAAQIRISVALGMASNPTLRVLRIKDGSLLDKNSLKLIEEMTVEHDYQTWIETVNAGDRVAVVMEDGEASGEEAEKETARK